MVVLTEMLRNCGKLAFVSKIENINHFIIITYLNLFRMNFIRWLTVVNHDFSL